MPEPICLTTSLCRACEDLLSTKESLQQFADVSDELTRGVFYARFSELESRSAKQGSAGCALCSLIVKALVPQLHSHGKSDSEYKDGQVWLTLSYDVPVHESIEFPVPWDTPITSLEPSLYLSEPLDDHWAAAWANLALHAIPGKISCWIRYLHADDARFVDPVLDGFGLDSYGTKCMFAAACHHIIRLKRCRLIFK